MSRSFGSGSRGGKTQHAHGIDARRASAWRAGGQRGDRRSVVQRELRVDALAPCACGVITARDVCPHCDGDRGQSTTFAEPIAPDFGPDVVLDEPYLAWEEPHATFFAPEDAPTYVRDAIDVTWNLHEVRPREIFPRAMSPFEIAAWWTWENTLSLLRVQARRRRQVSGQASARESIVFDPVEVWRQEAALRGAQHGVPRSREQKRAQIRHFVAHQRGKIGALVRFKAPRRARRGDFVVTLEKELLGLMRRRRPRGVATTVATIAYGDRCHSSYNFISVDEYGNRRCAACEIILRSAVEAAHHFQRSMRYSWR